MKDVLKVMVWVLFSSMVIVIGVSVADGAQRTGGADRRSMPLGKSASRERD
jgi:hypothetical protein